MTRTAEILLDVFLCCRVDQVTLDPVILRPQTEAVLTVDIVTELLPGSGLPTEGPGHVLAGPGQLLQDQGVRL